MPSSNYKTCSWCGKRFDTLAEDSGSDEPIDDCPDCRKSILAYVAPNGAGEVAVWSAGDER